MQMFLQQIVIGLTIGSIYSLIALGYTMVYGILELVNFAHGEIFMIGSYIGLMVLMLCFSSGLQTAVPVLLLLLLAFVVAMVVSALFGMAIERLAYRPLRQSPRLSLLITALGVSIFLQNLAMLIFGARDRPYPEKLFPNTSYHFWGVQVTLLQILIFTIALVLMFGLNLLIHKTRLGTAMRATAQDTEAAGLMGIHVNFIVLMTFAIGSALGGAAGVLYGLYYGVANFFMGFQAGLKAFTAAVLGGIGNITGAMVGGLLLGVFESLAAAYISSQWKDVITFGMLILVLVFRPQGLFGEQVPEKV